MGAVLVFHRLDATWKLACAEDFREAYANIVPAMAMMQCGSSEVRGCFATLPPCARARKSFDLENPE